ncbi:glycine cleavage T C-terminal barrel domain-containing protein [Paludisphaera sp.]|uniref:CAF17-like 4Fe-4S cluster assembly/insertion protein YgfZ n=1 Tax=Paludisphaera sp. TaxID=2017432 RepID=UPI00301CA336
MPQPTGSMTTTPEQYRAARESAAWIDHAGRSRMRVGGPDRAKFLHNLTTNDIKRLAVGRGCETFVTSPQGKTLAFLVVHALPDAILLRSDPGGMDLALPHLRKYGIFDDVAIEDSSAETSEFHVMGPGAAAWLEGVGATLPDEADLSSTTTTVAGVDVLLVRESPAGIPGFTLIADAEAGARLAEALRGSGLPALDAEVYDALRIEAGTPAFGRDVNDRNLPQELDRDPRAISFVKGCYLGQETVARLDALGHVNKILRRLVSRPGEPVPPEGVALEAGGKAVGTITSSATSPGRGAGVALGVVRVSHASPGSTMTWTRPGDAEAFVVTVDDPPLLRTPA